MKLDLGVKTRLKNNLYIEKKGFHCNPALSLLPYVTSWTCSCGSFVLNCLYFRALKKPCGRWGDIKELLGCTMYQLRTSCLENPPKIPSWSHAFADNRRWLFTRSLKSTLWFKWVRTFRMKNKEEKNGAFLRFIPCLCQAAQTNFLSIIYSCFWDGPDVTHRRM